MSLWASSNHAFFAGTSVESAVAEQLDAATQAARLTRALPPPRPVSQASSEGSVERRVQLAAEVDDRPDAAVGSPERPDAHDVEVATQDVGPVGWRSPSTPLRAARGLMLPGATMMFSPSVQYGGEVRAVEKAREVLVVQGVVDRHLPCPGAGEVLELGAVAERGKSGVGAVLIERPEDPGRRRGSPARRGRRPGSTRSCRARWPPPAR